MSMAGLTCSPSMSPGRPVITLKMKGPTGMSIPDTSKTSADPKHRTTIEPITMRVPQACRYLGIGRSTLYVLINEGKIEIIKLGSSTLVLTESLRSLVEKKRKGLNQSTDKAP